jgi:multiple sugar transport system substrate-binding protein
VVVLVLSLLLAACGAPAATSAPTSAQATQGAPSQGGEAVTITFWNGFNAHEVDTLNQMIEKYWSPTHPNIKVIAEGEKSGDVLLAAMSGGDPPDVIMAPGPDVISLWAHQGAIEDLTAAVNPVKEQFESEQVKAGLDWVKYQDKYYALPFVNFNWGFFYNKDLFAAAGLDPEKPPQTLDELKDYARQLTKTDSNGNITQLGWMPINNVDRAINFAMAFGGKFVDLASGAPTLTDPKIVAAFQWDLELAKEFGLDKVNAFTTGFTEGDNPFQLGKVAMYIDGCWMPEFFKNYAPELNYGVGAIPYTDPAFKGAGNVGTNPIVIPVGAKHKQEAQEFAVFFSMNKDISREFSALISNIPQIKSELATFTENPNTRLFADFSNTQNAGAWAPVPFSSQYADELNSAIGQMYNEGIDPQTALANSQTVLEGAAQEYK